jgi:hypothetical protein
VKLYAGTAKNWIKTKSENMVRRFLPDLSLSFGKQIMEWGKQVDLMDRQRREKDQKRAELTQRRGALVRELNGLGITFDAMGNPKYDRFGTAILP